MNKKQKIGFILVIVFIGALILLFKNNNSAPVVSSNQLQVTASFYPLYFFSQQIGGEKANVTNITPAGAEPHDYEPTAQDIIQIENSKLLVLNGGGLEAWGKNIKQNIDSNRTLVITAGEKLANQQITEEGENIVDPHIWLSPPLASQMVDKITQGFTRIDSANADYYENNANMLKLRLSDLDEKFKQGLSNCAQESIVTSHAAFGYLASAYHFKQVSVSGLSPDIEPSPRQLRDIAEFARINQVKYIFFESLVSPKLSETIAGEVGAETLVLNPLEGLTRQEIAQGKNYFTEMESNLHNLQIALQCQK